MPTISLGLAAAAQGEPLGAGRERGGVPGTADVGKEGAGHDRVAPDAGAEGVGQADSDRVEAGLGCCVRQDVGARA